MRGKPDSPDRGAALRTEWRVRPARASDRNFVLGITPRLAQGFDLPEWRTPREVVEAESATLEQALASAPDHAALLIADDPAGASGGYVYVHLETDYFGRTHAHIGILAVSSAAEGRGAGRALIEAAEAWARGEGLDLITLNVFASNLRARTVYERLGYEPVTLHYAKPLT